MPRFLHIGSGKNTKREATILLNRPDWEEVRLDADLRLHPDIVATVTDMSMVPSNSFDVVYSAHTLEHLVADDVRKALVECLRVLRLDGHAVAICPDLEAASEALITQGPLARLYESTSGAVITPFDMIYGHRSTTADGNVLAFHKSGFTLELLMSAFAAAGFASISGVRVPERFEIFVIGTKTLVPAGYLDQLAHEHLMGDAGQAKVDMQVRGKELV